MWLQLLVSQILIWLLQLLRLETAIMARQLSCWSWCNSHLPKAVTAIPADPGFHAVPHLLLLLPPAQPMATATFHSFSCCHSRKLFLPWQSLHPHLILVATTWLVLHHDTTTHILSMSLVTAPCFCSCINPLSYHQLSVSNFDIWISYHTMIRTMIHILSHLS
jgi:hypothetical protein